MPVASAPPPPPPVPPHRSPTAAPPTWGPQSGPAKPKRTWWIVAGAAAAVAVVGGVTAGLLTGMGGGDDPEPGPTGAAFAEMSAEDIVREAEKEMKVLDTVSIAGDVTGDDGQAFDIDMTVSSRGDCAGTMGVGDGSAELLSVGGDTWFKPDRGFWEEVAENPDDAVIDQILALQGDNWVVLPPEDATEFADFCDLDELLEDDSVESGDPELSKDGTEEIDGQQVVKITSTTSEGESASYVSLDDPHYILRLEEVGQGGFDLTEFDEPLEVEAPGADEVVNFDDVE